MIEEDTYTFIGADEDGGALFMDIAVFNGEGFALRHGARLFDMHDNGDRVEIWRGASLVASIPRPSARDTGRHPVNACPGPDAT